MMGLPGPFAAAALMTLFLVALGVAVIVAVPVHPQDAALNALDCETHYDTFVWTCPGDGGTPDHIATLTLGISESEFLECSRRVCVRQGTAPLGPHLLVDPEDPNVRAVAQHVIAETEGYSEAGRVAAALRFVQQTVEYAEDREVWGAEDFYAFPTEVLYLRSGDCEDVSVLLCSVLLAMGQGCVLLTTPGHVAAAAELDDGPGTTREFGGRQYRLCEATSERDLGDWYGDDWTAVGVSERDPVGEAASTFLAGYRTIIRGVLGT